MAIDFLLERFREFRSRDAFVLRGQGFTYEWLLTEIEAAIRELRDAGVDSGTSVMLRSDYSPQSIATLLALAECPAITTLVPDPCPQADELEAMAKARLDVRVEQQRRILSNTGVAQEPEPALFRQLRGDRKPGLVLITSGSSGKPKGVVHDFSRFLKKYRVRRHTYRTLGFLPFDHVAGLDTALYSLSNGSCLVLCEDRNPDAVCRLVEEERVEVLPVAPSFLRLLSLSNAHERHDLSSLAIVTYGAEVMPEATLQRCTEMFPGVRLLQKYGTSELGTLRSRSKGSGSLWVQIGGEDHQIRVVDGLLEIRSQTSMIGYLNAESPFSPDGWLRTGDHVEQDGDFIRFLGRESDLVSVGGEKIHPAEVETVIREVDNVGEVVVFGRPNALLGQILCAEVSPVRIENAAELSREIRRHCLARLGKRKTPVDIAMTDRDLVTSRFKLRRRDEPDP